MPLVLNHYHWVGEDMVVGARKNRWGWVQGAGEEKGVGGRLTCWQNSCLLSHAVLAWLLVTPPDGELAPKLVGVPKGWEAGEIEGNPEKVLNIAQSKKGWREEAKKKGAGARGNWRQAIRNPCPYLYTASGRLSFPRARCGKQKSKLCKLMEKGGELSPRSLRQSRSPFTRALGLRWFKRKIWGCSQSTPPPTSPPPPPTPAYWAFLPQTRFHLDH